MSNASPTDADDIRHEIEQTRADLADTVDALTAKLDVKARAKAKVQEARPYGGQILAAAIAAALTVVLLARRRARRSR